MFQDIYGLHLIYKIAVGTQIEMAHPAVSMVIQLIMGNNCAQAAQ